jgi:ribonucleoside-diphosphate reductase alpha chain
MPVNRTQIARTIFSAAESMGISDREKIERMIDQVIERIEPRLLPGMEGLISDAKNKVKYSPSVTEIQNLVKEILAKEESTQSKDNQKEPKMETTVTKATVKIQTEEKKKEKMPGGLALTENALHVLEKRYLKKDKSGKPIETPAELFRRVAQRQPESPGRGILSGHD